MISANTILAFFKELADNPPKALNLDPDNLDMSIMGVQNYGIRQVIRAIRRGQGANDVEQSKQWLFEHGFLVGVVLGIMLGRDEPTPAQYVSSLNWAALDVPFGK